MDQSNPEEAQRADCFRSSHSLLHRLFLNIKNRETGLSRNLTSLLSEWSYTHILNEDSLCPYVLVRDV